MRKVLYMLRRIAKLDYKGMFRRVSEVKRHSKRPSVFIFFDMIYCGFHYGAGYMDYAACRFDKLNSKQRATYVTRGINDGYVAKYNDQRYRDDFVIKTKFNAIFGDFLKRSWIGVQDASHDDVIEWLATHDPVFAKPVAGTGGHFMEVLSRADFANIDDAYQHLIDNGLDLLEEVVVQDDQMARLNRGCVNTIRIVTFIDDANVTRVMFACLRMGTGDNIVDNFHHAGLTTPIEIETGILRFPAVSKDGDVFDIHPTSGVPIVGFQIPRWDECIDFTIKASHVVPQVRYVGWDVALTKDGPVLIEGNEAPGNDLYQMPAFLPDGMGLLPRFRQYMK
ncbi:MAG: hypothetical protein FWD80_00630 [Propionibacteriaceae bacterium]|nr:hypothetical protein [Propionibacteriaceae bacterium]